MLARIGWGAALGLVTLVLIAYVVTIFGVLPPWVWVVASLGAWILRRWFRLRRAGLLEPADADGPRWSPTRGGGL